MPPSAVQAISCTTANITTRPQIPMTAVRGCRRFMQLSTVYGHGVWLKPGTPRFHASPSGVEPMHRGRTFGLTHEREGVEDVPKFHSGQSVHARDSCLELS